MVEFIAQNCPSCQGCIALPMPTVLKISLGAICFTSSSSYGGCWVLLVVFVLRQTNLLVVSQKEMHSWVQRKKHATCRMGTKKKRFPLLFSPLFYMQKSVNLKRYSKKKKSKYPGYLFFGILVAFFIGISRPHTVQFFGTTGSTTPYFKPYFALVIC